MLKNEVVWRTIGYYVVDIQLWHRHKTWHQNFSRFCAFLPHDFLYFHVFLSDDQWLFFYKLIAHWNAKINLLHRQCCINRNLGSSFNFSKLTKWYVSLFLSPLLAPPPIYKTAAHHSTKRAGEFPTAEKTLKPEQKLHRKFTSCWAKRKKLLSILISILPAGLQSQYFVKCCLAWWGWRENTLVLGAVKRLPNTFRSCRLFLPGSRHQ